MLTEINYEKLPSFYLGLEKGIERGIEKGIERGIEKGLQDGINIGFIDGEKKKSMDVIKNSISLGIDTVIISKLTGLGVDEIEEIKRSL